MKLQILVISFVLFYEPFQVSLLQFYTVCVQSAVCQKATGGKKKNNNNISAAVAQICGLMSQNPEPNKPVIIYAVNISNNHLCVLFKYLSWDVNYVIKYQ